MGVFDHTILHRLDWIAIFVYFILVLAIGLFFIKRGGSSTEDFFIAGRSLPWWIAGTSIVATMFAADTPLFHSGNVRRFGLDAGWMFFTPGFGIIFAAVLFARLWRRSRVITEIELLEIRYSGPAAASFRGFNAIYGGLFQAALTMGWVTLAMGVVVESFLGISRTLGIWIFLGIVLVYSVSSGIWGVVMTDFLQYIIATAGSIVLAYKAVAYCGGLEAMNISLSQINQWPGITDNVVRVLPQPSAWNPVYSIWLLIGWTIATSIGNSTASGFVGQRIYASKNETHASVSLLWFCFCYYVLNGWPWLVTGAASIIVLGATNEAAGLRDYQETFPAMIQKLMPIGWRGFMVASLIAAFMSTIDTILNWGSSYIVNDFYRRFIVKQGSQRHYVWISRFVMLALALFGGWFALQFETITEMLLSVSKYFAGSMLVGLFRWLWWRTNIWSEISAVIASVFVALFVDKILAGYFGIWSSEDVFRYYGHQMLTIMACTTVIWVLVTLFTKPVDDNHLVRFYRRIGPPGPGWRRIRLLCGNDKPAIDSGSRLFFTWLTGVIGIFGILIAIGFVITCRWLPAVIIGAGTAVSIVGHFALYATLTHYDDIDDNSSDSRVVAGKNP